MVSPEVVAPGEDIETTGKEHVVLIPRYHVVLWDDNDHTYDYVVEMLIKLFGHTVERAFQMAVEVDTTGKVIVETTSRERAEFKQEQIHTYGADWRIPHCKGSMSATIEPAEDIED
ncbi:MAG: ATP-dependent Clp protease adaptor ClpS [bacterium]